VLQTLNVHTDSVWCLAATADFGLVYSGGRDRAVYCTHMVMRKAWLLAREQQPIRSIVGDVMLMRLVAVMLVACSLCCQPVLPWVWGDADANCSSRLCEAMLTQLSSSWMSQCHGTA